MGWKKLLLEGDAAGGVAVEEDDVEIVSVASVLDFGSGFDITESPAGEANIALDVDESPLSGLAKLVGRSGGQTFQGGVAASEDLTLESTAHATKGKIIFPGFWDADKDTGIQVEESTDEDKVRIDTGGVERLVIDSQGGDFKGQLRIMGSSYSATPWLNVSPVTPSFGAAYGIAINPSNPSVTTGTGSFHGVFGTPSVFIPDAATAVKVRGLHYQAVAAALSKDGTVQFCDAIYAKAGCLGAGTADLIVSALRGLYVDTPQITDAGSSLVVTKYAGIQIGAITSSVPTTAIGLEIGDVSAAPTSYILELGPTGVRYLRLLGSGSWTPADYTTPLYLAADDPVVLHQVTVGSNDSGGGGYRCLRIPNL